MSHSQSNCVIASSVIGRRFFLNKKMFMWHAICVSSILGKFFCWVTALCDIYIVLQMEQEEEVYRKKFIYTHVYLSWYSHLHNYLASSFSYSCSLFALFSSFLYFFYVVAVYVIYEKGRRRRQRQTKDIRGVWKRHKGKDLRRTFYYIEHVYMQAKHVSYSYYCS